MATIPATTGNSKNDGGSIARAGDINNPTKSFGTNITNSIERDQLAVQNEPLTLFSVPIDTASTNVSTYDTEIVLRQFPVTSSGIRSLGFRVTPITSPTINIDNLAAAPSSLLTTINAKQFGAQGSGDPSRDDRPSIQAAIDFANWQGMANSGELDTKNRSHGFEVFLPPGTYYVNDSILLPQTPRLTGGGAAQGFGRGAVRLRGAGMNTTKIFAMDTFPGPVASLLTDKDAIIKGVIEWAPKVSDIITIVSANGGAAILVTTSTLHMGGSLKHPYAIRGSAQYDGLHQGITKTDRTVTLDTAFTSNSPSGQLITGTDALAQEISHLSINAPNNSTSGICPIARKIVGSQLNDVEATQDSETWESQRFTAHIHDIKVEGDLLETPAGIWMDGSALQCVFERIRGEIEPGGDFHQHFPATHGFLVRADYRVLIGASSPALDRSGFQSSQMINCHGGNSQLFWGRLNGSVINGSFSAGWNNSPVVKIMNSIAFEVRDVGMEGRSEIPAAIQIVNSWFGNLNRITFGKPTVWPPTAPGSGFIESQQFGHGILLQNCRYTNVNGRTTRIGVGAYQTTKPGHIINASSGHYAFYIDADTKYTNAVGIFVNGAVSEQEIRIDAPASEFNYVEGVNVETARPYAVGQHPLFWREGSEARFPGLSQLHDIQATAPNDNQVLAYNATLGHFVPAEADGVVTALFEPSGLGGLLLDYNLNRASGMLTGGVETATDGIIDIWQDFSGNNWNATASNNNRGTARADARDKRYCRNSLYATATHGTTYEVNTNFASSSGDYTIYAAMDVPNAGNGWVWDLNATARIILKFQDSVGGSMAYQDDVAVYRAPASTYRQGRHILTWRLDGNAGIGKMWIDGGAQAGSGAWDGQSITTGGGERAFYNLGINGEHAGMYHFMFFEGVHTADEMDQVHQYLSHNLNSMVSLTKVVL